MRTPALGMLLFALAGHGRARADLARWQVDAGLSYGQSIDLANTAAGRAHLPTLRLRGTRAVGARTRLGVELLCPMFLAGQVGAGLVLKNAWALREPRPLPHSGGLVAAWGLTTAVSIGWLYQVSELDEGFIRLSDQALKLHGPYARGEVGARWAFRPEARRSEVGVGVAVGAAALWADYSVPQRAAAARLDVDAMLTVDVSW